MSSGLGLDPNSTQTRVSRFFLSEQVIMTVIIITSFSLFCMGFSRPEQTAWWIFFYIDYFCLIYFIFEAFFKIKNLSFKTYIGSGWNKFDFLIVLFSLPTLLSPFYDLQDFAIILAVRLGRLFRLLRLIRFIPNREHLIKGLSRSLKASVGVFIALLIINLIFALGATFLFHDRAPEHFENPVISLYSMFKIFTVEGWYEIPDQIAENSDKFWAVFSRIYFVIAVLVGGILGLSLANAVFVDEMTVDNTDAIEVKIDALQEEVKEIKDMLNRMSGQKK